MFNTLKLCSPNYVEVASWKSVGKPIEEITLSEIIVTTEVKHSQEGDLSFKFAKNKWKKKKEKNNKHKSSLGIK